MPITAKCNIRAALRPSPVLTGNAIHPVGRCLSLLMRDARHLGSDRNPTQGDQVRRADRLLEKDTAVSANGPDDCSECVD